MEIPIQVFVKDGELVDLPKPVNKSTVRVWKDDQEAVELKKDNEGSPIGGCSFSHEILMLLSLKQKVLGEEQFHFSVHPVSTAKLPPVFHQQALHHVPALVDFNTGTATDNLLDILQYLDTQYPTPALFPVFASEQAMLRAENACYEVFQKFYSYIKGMAKDSQKLHAALKALNACLLENASPEASFTTNAGLTNFDTEVMPLLHQIRIATTYLTSYRIPDSFTGIWRYLATAYDYRTCPSFVKWCPSDQEVVFAWMNVIQVATKDKQQDGQLQMSRDKIRLLKMEPSYTFSVPLDL